MLQIGTHVIYIQIVNNAPFWPIFRVQMAQPDGRQPLILTILRMQVLYLVLVIADPWHSCCSAYPVLQRRKHFVGRQKATQIVLPPETNQ